MSQSQQKGAPRGNVDFHSGRAATRQELRARLSSAPPRFLAGALDNPELTESEVLLLLRNRAATADVLQRIASDGRWTRSYEIKRGLVFHAHTAPLVARALVGHLHWRELTELSVVPHVNPVLRRRAEELLAVRLAELAVGERVALCRRASRGVILGLLQTDEGQVLRSLLDNARLIEADALRIASGTRVPAETLAQMAVHARWSPRRAVRLALLANPRTPIADALRLLQGLQRQDLRRIARDVKVRKVVRVGAARRLRSDSEARCSLAGPRGDHA